MYGEVADFYVLSFNLIIIVPLTLFYILFSYLFIYLGVKNILKKEKIGFIYFAIDYLFFLFVQYVESYKGIVYSFINDDTGFSITSSFSFLSIFVLFILIFTYCAFFLINKKQDLNKN